MKNSGISITSPEEFQSVITALEASYNKIKDIIDKEKKNVERINQTKAWTGKTAAAVYNKYALLNTNYEQIDYSLDVYIKFLKKTLEDYTIAINEQSKNIDAMAANLDVNS